MARGVRSMVSKDRHLHGVYLNLTAALCRALSRGGSCAVIGENEAGEGELDALFLWEQEAT
jgi:hypothetical protein